MPIAIIKIEIIALNTDNFFFLITIWLIIIKAPASIISDEIIQRITTLFFINGKILLKTELSDIARKFGKSGVMPMRITITPMTIKRSPLTISIMFIAAFAFLAKELKPSMKNAVSRNGIPNPAAYAIIIKNPFSQVPFAERTRIDARIGPVHGVQANANVRPIINEPIMPNFFSLIVIPALEYNACIRSQPAVCNPKNIIINPSIEYTIAPAISFCIRFALAFNMYDKIIKMTVKPRIKNNEFFTA